MPRGGHGISAFILERCTPGLVSGRKENKLGMRASDTAEVSLSDCSVPDDQLLGAVGEGFVEELRVLDAGRIGIAALAVGLAQGAYEAARRYATQREQFGQPIASFQAIQFKLADMATRIEAARRLTYRAAYLKNEGRVTTREWRWPSYSQAKQPCGSPRTGSRFMVGTDSSRTTLPRSSSTM
jgi:alkylation response protein AidB-like acyl-CoA dehydrogenase